MKYSLHTQLYQKALLLSILYIELCVKALPSQVNVPTILTYLAERIR